MKTTSIPGILKAILLTTIALATPLVCSQDDQEKAPAVSSPGQLEEESTASDTPETESTTASAGEVQKADLAPVSTDTEPQEVTSHARLNSRQQELAHRRAIEQMESSEGAYATGLSESLLSLALTLQDQGRHDEAIKLFKRGVHLARINEGLYCPQQIPLLQAEVASHKAVRNYLAADERQDYLYRVQTKSGADGVALAGAFMDQAKWQYEAFQLGLEQDNYTRLMEMTDLYRQAASDIMAREGEKSPDLLPPLHGMLQAQYLISSYEVQAPQPVFGEEGRIDEGLLRFKKYQAQSYQQGNAIIAAISNIEEEHNSQGVPTIAQTKVMLGDWRLWNGKTQAAWEAYREAAMELARSGAAQDQELQWFAEPVALPDIAGVSLLPPMVEPNQEEVTLAFGVSAYGRVQDIERLDSNEEEDRLAYRLMRQLRKTTFRPRIEAGQPVETEKIVKAFHLQ